MLGEGEQFSDNLQGLGASRYMFRFRSFGQAYQV